MFQLVFAYYLRWRNIGYLFHSLTNTRIQTPGVCTPSVLVILNYLIALLIDLLEQRQVIMPETLCGVRCHTPEYFSLTDPTFWFEGLAMSMSPFSFFLPLPKIIYPFEVEQN
jgi:hypothetical protein